MLWALLLAAGTASAPALAARSDGTVEWRGRAVCVDETGGMRECLPTGNRYALQSAEGSLHWLAATDPLAPVFDDLRIRAQEVVLKVRPSAEGTAELVKVYSAKHGKLHDVRYFCEVCNVTSFVYQLCPCCRAEMELRETPVE